MTNFWEQDEIVKASQDNFWEQDRILSEGQEIPQSLLNAYVGGKMSTEERIQFEEDIQEGIWKVPEGGRFGEGVFERTKNPGFFQRLSDLVTGRQKRVEETEALPDWMAMPEMSRFFDVQSAKAQLATIATNPEESAQIVQSMFPDVQVRQDEKGNYIFRSAVDNKEYAIKPGFRVTDIPRAAATMGAFTPAGRAITLPRGVGGAALTQAGIEATQEAAGGEFDIEQVPAAGVTELLGRGISRVIQSAKGPLQRGYARFIGEEAPELPAVVAVREAEAAGVPVLTTDVLEPRTFAARLAQATTERIPIVGTGPVRAAQAETRIKAVKDLLRNFGADEVADVSDDIVNDLLKKRGFDLNKYSTMRKEVLERLSEQGTVPVDDLLKTLDDEITDLRALASPGGERAATFFEGYREAFQDKDLVQIDLLRREMGDMLSSEGMADVKTVSEKTARKLYREIQKATGDFIKDIGERRDFNKWNVGTKKLAAMMGDLESTSLKSILRKGDIEPEKVKTLLFSQKPSQIKLLYKNLTPDGRARARVALLQKAAEKAGGISALSAEKFKSEIKRLSKSTGIFFEGADKKALDGLTNALYLTERATGAAVKPPTGAELTAFAAPSYISYLLGGDPLTGAAAVAGIGGLARLFESRPVRNVLIRFADATPGMETELMKELTAALQAARQIPEEE